MVIPVYQVEAYLDESLGSVRAQSFADLQIVVVDDGSTDASLAIARRHARADRRIEIVVHSTNRGLPAARNSGMKRARGEYVFHLDSDDYIAPGTIERLHRHAVDSAADVTFCRGQVFDQDGKWGLAFPPRMLRRLDGIGPAQFMPCWQFMSVWLGLYRREFLLRNDIAFDEYPQLGEDHIFLARCLPKARKISTLAEELYFYRRRPGSVSDYGNLDALTIAELVACSRRVSELYARLPLVRQQYLLDNVNTQIARMVVVAHAGERQTFEQITRGFAQSFIGLDMELVRSPQHQPWRPPTVVPSRYVSVADALASGEPSRLRSEVMELARTLETPAVLEARRLRRIKSPQALEAAAEAARCEPSNPEAHLIYGDMLTRKRTAAQRSACLPALVRASELAPDSPEIARATALAHLRDRHFAEAEAAAGRAVLMRPGDGRSYQVKALIALAQDKTDEAIAALVEERRLMPGLARNYVDMARAELRAGRLDQAIRELQSMWRRVPGRYEKRQQYWGLIATLAGRKDKGETLALLRRACERDGASARLARLVATALEQRASRGGQNGKAQPPPIWDQLSRINGVLERAGDAELALAAAEAEVFSLPEGKPLPRRALAQLRLAKGHARAGHPWSAVRALHHARRLAPASPPCARAANVVVAALKARGADEAAADCEKIFAASMAESGSDIEPATG